jgi:hypothetical protein
MDTMTLQKIWSPEEIQIVRNMAEQNASASKIGEAIKRSRNSVMGIAFRNGIKLLNRKVRGQKVQKPPAKKGEHLKRKFASTAEKKEKKYDEPFITAPSGKNNVPFLERRSNQCKFIIGRTEKSHYCCGDPVDRKGWCKYHASIVYQPPDYKPLKRDDGNGVNKTIPRFAE